jgi:PKD repeat protein
VAPVIASQAVGIYTATVFTFSAQGTGFEAGSLTYRWEFGDGGTSSEPAPTHVYEAPGTYAVVVTIADARQSARSQMSVTVIGLTGTWVRASGRANTLHLTQSGGTISGIGDFIGFTPGTGAETAFTGCEFAGSVQRAVPVAVSLILPGCRNPETGATLRPARITLTVSPDGRTMDGFLAQEGAADTPYSLIRQ